MAIGDVAMFNNALLSAAREGDLPKVRHYVKEGADVNCPDLYGWTALIWAASRGNLEIVNALLERGAKVDQVNEDGNTALMEAARYGYLRVVEHLVREGAKVDHVNLWGNTALMWAARYNHLKVVSYLIKERAGVDLANEGGKTAEHLAFEHGHVRVALLLKEARLTRAVREISQDHRFHKISQVESAPIKLYALGKAYAGKTEILRSLFHKDNSYQVIDLDTKKYNKGKIKEKYETRTIGINVFNVKIKEQRVSIFDCGGLGNYYMLHSLFTKVDNSIILLVFSLTRDDQSLKEEQEIKTELKQQIAFIKSKSARKCNDNVILVGTHKDLLDEEQIESCHVMMAQLSTILGHEEDFKFPLWKLVNAKDRENADITGLSNEIASQSKAIVDSLDDDKKNAPSFCFSACERLREHSKDTNDMVLHWTTVYKLMAEVAMESSSVLLDKRQAFDILALLDTFGMLLVSQPEGFSKEEIDKHLDKLFVIPDLNWFFSKFLGVIFSPSGYLQHPEICRNGYVCLDDLAKAFRGFDLSKEQIVTILKEYKVVCDGKKAGELLIPGALSNEKRTEWNCCGDKYEFILGRRCENVGVPFNIGTMPEILSRLGQMWPTQSMEFYYGGVFIYHDKAEISVECVELQKAIEVRVGLRKDHIKESSPNEILEDLRRLMDIVYLQVVCGTAE